MRKELVQKASHDLYRIKKAKCRNTAALLKGIRTPARVFKFEERDL